MSKYFRIDKLDDYYNTIGNNDWELHYKITSLPKRTQVICKMIYTGDYCCADVKDRVAEHIKDLKEKGYSTNFETSYSKVKVARSLGISPQTVARHFKKAHDVVGSFGYIGD